MTPEREKEAPACLGLDTEYWDECACTNFDSNSGAGANAGPFLNSVFYGTDRLSEVVWSPRKGLYLKCADGSSSMERPFVLCHATPLSIPSTEVDPSNKVKFPSFPDLHSQGESSGRNVPVHSSCNKRKWPRDLSHEQSELCDYQMDCLEIIVGPPASDDRTDVAGIQIGGNDPASINVSRDMINRMKKDALVIEAHTSDEFGDLMNQMGPLINKTHKLQTFTKRKVKSDPGYCGLHFLARHGSPLRGQSCPLATDIIVHGSTREGRTNWKEDLRWEGNVAADPDLPSTSRMHGPAFLGNIPDSIRTEKNSSDESVESCSRAGLSSSTKFAEPRVIVKSREVQNNVQNSSSSFAYSGQGSSFLIWISNMVKGCQGFGGAKEPLPLKIEGPERGGNARQQPVFGCDIIPGSSGFSALVGPLYNSQRDSHEKYSLQLARLSEQSKVLELDDKVADANVPLRGHATNNVACKRLRHTDALCNITEVDRDVNLTFNVKDMAKMPATLKTTEKCTSVGVQKLIDVAADNSQYRRTSPPVQVEQRKLADQIKDSACRNHGKGFSKSWVAYFNQDVSVKTSREYDGSTSFRKGTFPTDLTEIVDDANKDQKWRENFKEATPLSCSYKNEFLALKNDVEASGSEVFGTKFQVSSEMDYSVAPSENRHCHFTADLPSKCDGRSEEETRQGSTKSISSHHEEMFLNKIYPESAVGCSLAVNNFIRTPLVTNLQSAPEPIFDTVKGLQVSRSNILKWIKSQQPLSHLYGLFLRVRHGKCETRIDGTGYLVGWIIGEQRENLPSTSRNSVFVNMEGNKCWVECQFISNQDFLKDELITWWSSTSQRGDEIPTLEDLQLKLERKKMLGL